jgi:hypothetical protein
VVLHLNIRVLYLHKYVCVSILQHVLLLFSFRVVLQNQSLDHIYHQKVNAVDLIVIILEIVKLLDLAHLWLLGCNIFFKVWKFDYSAVVIFPVLNILLKWNILGFNKICLVQIMLFLVFSKLFAENDVVLNRLRLLNLVFV